MSRPRTKRTPTQAASARQLDYWQNEVAGIMRSLSVTGRIDVAIGRLARLAASMRRSERR